VEDGSEQDSSPIDSDAQPRQRPDELLGHLFHKSRVLK
jgi:hypothetical protein